MDYYRMWWDLPGSKSFTSRVVGDLQEGKNVVLCFPEHVPPGEKKDIKDDNHMDWYELSVEPDTNPLYFLYDKFVDCSPDDLRNISNLANNEQFQGKCIWIEGIDTRETWKKWSDFLTKYEGSIRGIDSYDRTVFCIKVTGELALELPQEDVCLSIHKWENVIQSIDMLFFATQCFENSLIEDRYLELAILISTKIAKWDFNLYLRLANESLGTLLNPESLLSDFASEREWVKDDIDSSTEEQWVRGQYNSELPHTALLRQDDNYQVYIDKGNVKNFL